MSRPTIQLITIRNQLAFGPRILHAVLENAGHVVESIFAGDHFLDPQPLSDSQIDIIAQHVRYRRPRMVGLSLTSYAFQDAIRISARIRAIAKDVLIIWGGHHPTIAPDQCIDHTDFVCRGEGEDAITAIAELLSTNSEDEIRALPNISFKTEAGETVHNPVADLEQNIDELPAPDFSNRNKLYLYGEELCEISQPYDDLTEYYMMTARGCPYHCTFCCVSFMREAYRGRGTFLRRRSVESVIQELKLAKQRQPSLRVIYFYDDVFIYDLEWLKAFASSYKREIGLPFWCYGYVNMIRNDMVTVLKDAGLAALSMGIQSGSERVRRTIYRRPESDQALLKAAEIVNSHGLPITWDLICGPFETEEEKDQAFELFFKLPKPFSFHFHPLSYYHDLGITKLALEQKIITEDDVIGKDTPMTQSIVTMEQFLADDRISGDRHWRLLKLFGREDIPNSVIRNLLSADLEEVIKFIHSYDDGKTGHERLFSKSKVPSSQNGTLGRRYRMSKAPDAPSVALLETRMEGRARPKSDFECERALVVDDNWLEQRISSANE